MPISTADLNKAYLAYFGRPADITGLSYFKNLEQADVIKAFDASAESQALYGTNLVAKVNAIYNNLFNRDAEPAGLQYWVNQISTGAITAAGAAFAILNGAQGTDVTSVANKLTAAQAFVSALDTTPEIVGYNGLAAAQSARDWLHTVSQTPESLAAAVAGVDKAVSAATAAGAAGTGQTFTLTTNIDTITGTAGNDTIIGGVGAAGGNSTLGSADVINGGAGTDTLKLTTEGAVAVVATPNITSVEKVEVQALGTAGTTVNLVNATGVQEIWNARSTDALTVTNVQALATVGVKGDLGATAYAVQFKDSLVSGVADSVNIAVEDAKVAALNIGSSVAASEFETLSIAATGTNTITALNGGTGVALAATKTVNVTGAGKLTVTNALAGTVTTVDASANTGGVSFDLSATAAVKATGGAGNDTFKLGASLTTADVLDGGAGTDIIGVTEGNTLVTGLQVTGFETLDVGGAGGTANAFDVSKLSGITTLKVGSATVAGNAVTVNNLAKGAGVEINAALGNTLNVNVKDAGAGSPNDSIGVLVKGAAAFATTGQLAIKDIETVTLTADKSTATGNVTHTVTDLTVDQALTVKVANGNAGLTIADLNAKALVLFDATEATQAVSVTTLGGTAFTATNGVAFKFGAAADTLVLTGSTIAGGDFFITGGAGGDKITLTAAGAGTTVEHLVYGAAADSQSGLTTAGATKFDVITNFGDANVRDIIDLKALKIAAGQQSLFVKAPATAIGADGVVAAGDQLNFFVNAGAKNGVAIVAAADVDGNTGGAQAGAYVFIDANGDGNFNAADDLTIALVGVTAANLTAANFSFA